jgi:hypothetical protein
VTANFIDQAPAQRAYLDVVRKLGVSSRIAKAGGLGVCLLAGLLAAAILRSRSRSAAVVAGVLITLLLAAGLWNASRPRTAGGSHISIFYGR